MGTHHRIHLIAILIGAVSCYRLPETVVPNEYKLEIITNLADIGNKFDYSGKVVIEVRCVSPTKNITLHSKNLHIEKENVNVRPAHPNADESLKVTDVDLVKKDDFLVVHLSDVLKEDHKYELEIPFRADLEEGLAGYYKSYYTDGNGTKTWLAATQFEPSDARRAFPCFDEPAMKAEFTISLGRSKKYTSISNMPLLKTEDIENKPGWEWDRFETSIAMSTYLVAFVVSDFQYETSPRYENNVTFRTWARKEAIDQIGFAKDIGPKFLSFFEKYFDIAYPLPKQDMIALPDFSAGAMENWGLITYRENFLLADPKQSSVFNKMGIASVIAHELAHQWFGNLVTMKWWTDLWLNEGFATYMSAIATEEVFPQWKSLQEETLDNILDVFNFDSLENSHPVSVPIGHPDQIQEIFDTISYKKGSYLLHMMSNFLSAETLRMGVSNYLKLHMFSNAEKDDLWDSITMEAHRTATLPKNLTVKTVMDNWALQTGYPLLTVKRNYGHGSLEVKQERFFRDSKKLNSDSTKWWVPVTFTTEAERDFNNTKAKLWLSPDKNTVTLKGFPIDTDWVLFNLKASGLYRVNYDERNWNLLVNALKSDEFTAIPVLDRALLIENSANLAWIGRLDYKIFFDVVGYLEQEREYLPWKAALRNTDKLDTMLRRTSVYGEFKEYLRKIIKPIFKRIGGFQKPDEDDDKFDVLQHKTIITHKACKYRVEHCVSEAIGLFKNVQANLSKSHDSIPNNLRATIYCTVIQHGGEKEWSYLWNMYLKSNVASVKSVILTSLGCTRQSWLLERYLEWALDNNSGIRKHDLSQVFSSVIGNDVGFHIAKNFLQDNIKNIYNRVKPSVGKLSSILNTLASQMIRPREYEWLKNFTSSHPEYFSEIKQGVSQALEASRVNVQWLEDNFDSIKEQLQEVKS